MDVCSPTMRLSLGALPTTILPDFFFPQHHQETFAHNVSSGLSTSVPIKAKQTAAAESFGNNPAARGPTAHQTAILYGAFKPEQAGNNEAGMPAFQNSLPAPSHIVVPAAPAVSTFSREQQQVAMLHDLHMRHLQAAALQQHQQHGTAHHVGHSTLAPAAAANAAVSSTQHQHGYTAHGSFPCIGSNSNDNAVTATLAAGTAAGIDDMLVLCDEAVEVDSTSCSSSCSGFTSHSSMEMESSDNVDTPHQQQQHQSRLVTAAGKPAAIVLQGLNNIATQRKGYAALNPARASSSSKLADTAIAAAHAGSESVRARLLITEVSVYCGDIENHRCWASSPLALVQANKLMGSMALPEHTTYMPISSDSWIFQTATGYQFPSFVICLGSSYMQRMLATLPQLAEAASAVPEFECYCSYLPAKARPPPHTECLTGHELAATKATLRSIQFTCLFLALKVADTVHALGLLRYILTKISHNQRLVSFEDAADVQAQCLDALGWRLGPWFAETDLSGNDEELWAAAMGRPEYGTDADCWA